MIRTIFVCILLAVDWQNAVACETTNIEELKLHLASLPKVESLVFFASWCLECREHLKHANDNSVVVAVFETPDAANRTWKSTNQKRSLCFVDQNDSIADHYAVRRLPFKVSLID